MQVSQSSSLTLLAQLSASTRKPSPAVATEATPAPAAPKWVNKGLTTPDLVMQAKRFADGARAINAAQGLPEGQYDFTLLSAKQVETVLSDLVVNHGLDSTLASTVGQVGGEYIHSGRGDVPFDLIQQTSSWADFQDATSNSEGAIWLRTSLEALMAYQKGAETLNPSENGRTALTTTKAVHSGDPSAELNETSTVDQVVSDFLKEAKKTPMERLRERMLKSHGLSEQQFDELPNEAKAAIQREIAEAVKQSMKDVASGTAATGNDTNFLG